MLEQFKSENFHTIYDLMQQSFPSIEIRTYKDEFLLLNNPCYNILIYKNSEEVICGFLAVWDFDKFSYVEHFAVQPGFREHGIGTKMMKEYLKNVNKPVVIEVEAEKTEIAKRRIGFYKRLGFRMSDFSYIQPDLRKDSKIKVSLKIMSYPNCITERQFLYLKNQIFSKVYN